MVFSSPVFLFQFLPITLLLALLTGNRKAQNTVLLLASVLFYFWGEVVFGFLLIATALFNHLCGRLIESGRSKRTVLVFAVAANVATLAWFKYANLFVPSLNVLLERAALPPIDFSPVHLPIGISFFIFHSLSYVIDVYRGDAKAQREPGITTLYIALFPQLVAGPIIRYHDVAGQFLERVLSVEKFASGVRRFIVGLAKKVLVADLCARVADPIFDLPTPLLTPSVAWLALVAYAVQIYFDFSGYSDMAIGLGRMLGFEFLENFNRPYVARSVREFWKRWHISLTNWFRDYLYVPLGGNRRGPFRTYLNLLIVFLLTGLWHGPSWSYVVWGMIHGAFMVIERAGFGKVLERAPRIIGHAYTLLVVVVAWAFFRIEDITGAWRFTQSLFGAGTHTPTVQIPAFYLTTDTMIALVVGIIGGLGLLDASFSRFRARLEQRPHPVLQLGGSVSLLALFLLTCMAVATRTYDPFIYFRF